MELWCVKDNVKDSEIKFCVQTLYNLRLKKHSVEAVNREHILPYQNVWSTFGLIKKDMTWSELHLITYLYLKTLFLNLPTMDLNKGDDEDSDTEEKAMISVRPIEPVTHIRHILKVEGKHRPASITLLGVDSLYYLGIKVTLFDPVSVSETGFFLTVN